MPIDFLLQRFRERPDDHAIIWRDQPFTYGWLADAVEAHRARLQADGVPSGSVVALEADFSPHAVAVLLALVAHEAIVVPLTPSVEASKPEFRTVADVECIVELSRDDTLTTRRLEHRASHPLIATLRDRRHPGLVLFSSGSTGRSKAALHDFAHLLEKFTVRRHARRTLAFLLFDHIGGLNTLLYTLSNAGCLVVADDRAPDAVCAAIARHRVALLPTSPTFLNLLLLSEAWQRHDLSSLELVTYGTEVMPASTLARIGAVLPHVTLQQTYGLSEVGILRSRSESNDSLWVKLGGEGFETRIVDDKLEIRARSAMLGYLNHPSPFTDDGWFRTGDAVEVKGEYLRILGRRSELINVGGEKVYPAQVESVLQEMPGVRAVAVRGEPHPITGQVVTARIQLDAPEALPAFRQRMRAFVGDRLARWQLPQRIELVTEPLHSERFKLMR